MDTLAFLSALGTTLATFTGLLITYKNIVKELKKNKEERFNQINENIVNIHREITGVKKEIGKLRKETTETEIDRLRESILSFSERLRVREKLSYNIRESAFQIVFENYEKYKRLGGNGYIDQEMEFVEKVFKEVNG
jgi:septal ring factor EnvC (AmiA/AmiB activator)